MVSPRDRKSVKVVIVDDTMGTKRWHSAEGNAKRGEGGGTGEK